LIGTPKKRALVCKRHRKRSFKKKCILREDWHTVKRRRSAGRLSKGGGHGGEVYLLEEIHKKKQRPDGEIRRGSGEGGGHGRKAAKGRRNAGGGDALAFLGGTKGGVKAGWLRWKSEGVRTKAEKNR